jgi:hypothetical protein
MMSSFRRFATVLLLVVGSAGLAAPAPTMAAQPRVVAIAQARAMPLGTVVTVNGTATTPSGWAESSSFDKGFGLQDRTAGIYVSVAVDLDVVVGAKVRVTGELRDNGFGLLVLAPADPSLVRVHGHGPQIRPELRATGAVNESTEGSLVRVVGTITQAPVSDLPFGFVFLVDDGSGELTIFVTTQPNIDLSGLAVGQIVSVTGFSSQFDTHYEINPRFQSDIAVLAT